MGLKIEDKNGSEIMQVDKVRIEDLPSVITETYRRITDIDKSIKDSADMGDQAKSLALYASSKDAGWSVFGGNKKEAIEALQQAAVQQAKALVSSNSAIKQLFENQQKFSNAIQYLFVLGVANVAANRTVVRELELKLKNASKEELSDLARKEIQNVIRQLRAQEDMHQRLEGHDGILRTHKNNIGELNNSISGVSSSLGTLSESFEQEKADVRTYVDEKASETAKEINARTGELSNSISGVSASLVSLSETFEQEKISVRAYVEEKASDVANEIAAKSSELNNSISGVSSSLGTLSESFEQEKADVRTYVDEKASETAKEINARTGELSNSISGVSASLVSLSESFEQEKTSGRAYVDEKISETADTMKIKIEELTKKIADLEIQLNNKSFLDSSIYKIVIGIIALAAMIISVISLY